MSMVLKRILATAALGATLASTSIVETKAMPIPVTTADAIASPLPDRTGPVARVRLARLWLAGIRLARRRLGLGRRRVGSGPHRGRADRRSRSSALLWLWVWVSSLRLPRLRLLPRLVRLPLRLPSALLRI